MRQIKIGDSVETVIERSDYPPEKIRSILGSETVAILGYGVQGRGQSLNMKDNGVKVIVGQRPNTKSWDKAVQDGWDPGRVNSVVMLTDGQNEDPQGISLDRLVAELQKAMDPKRPIQVIALGIGTDVSKAELQKITSVTGGGVFITNDPANIADIFLQAIALRPAAR